MDVIKTAIDGVVIIEPRVFKDAHGYFSESFDIRKGSPTYGQHVAVELSEENHRQFFVPRGFAHGFAVLSETAVFQYKCDNSYAPEADGGISIVDGSLGIDWKINADKVLLSEKDTKHAFLKDFDSPFDINIDLYPKFK